MLAMSCDMVGALSLQALLPQCPCVALMSISNAALQQIHPTFEKVGFLCWYFIKHYARVTSYAIIKQLISYKVLNNY